MHRSWEKGSYYYIWIAQSEWQENEKFDGLVIKIFQIPCSNSVDFHLSGKNGQQKRQYLQVVYEDLVPQMF